MAATEAAEGAAFAIAESTERFRLLAEVVSLQVWTAQVNGELDYANQECLDYFGVTSGPEILGHAWAQFVHPDDLPKALEQWHASLTTGGITGSSSGSAATMANIAGSSSGPRRCTIAKARSRAGSDPTPTSTT